MIYLLAADDITAVAIVFPEQSFNVISCHAMHARLQASIHGSGSSDLDWIEEESKLPRKCLNHAYNGCQDVGENVPDNTKKGNSTSSRSGRLHATATTEPSAI